MQTWVLCPDLGERMDQEKAGGQPFLSAKTPFPAHDPLTAYKSNRNCS